MTRKTNSPSYRDKVYFGGNREKAILRDGEKCVKCGMTRKEHKERIGRDITVDHIDGNGCNKPLEEKNNALDNLQTLCLPCHIRKDSVRNPAAQGGQDAPQSKLTEADVIRMRTLFSQGVPIVKISKDYEVCDVTVSEAVNNKTWRHLEFKPYIFDGEEITCGYCRRALPRRYCKKHTLEKKKLWERSLSNAKS